MLNVDIFTSFLLVLSTQFQRSLALRSCYRSFFQIHFHRTSEVPRHWNTFLSSPRTTEALVRDFIFFAFFQRKRSFKQAYTVENRRLSWSAKITYRVVILIEFLLKTWHMSAGTPFFKQCRSYCYNKSRFSLMIQVLVLWESKPESHLHHSKVLFFLLLMFCIRRLLFLSCSISRTPWPKIGAFAHGKFYQTTTSRLFYLDTGKWDGTADPKEFLPLSKKSWPE